MFSGIISAVAKIRDKHTKNECLFLTIETPAGWQVKEGDSIATNGTCLTVKEVQEDYYITELMPETINKTYFASDDCTHVNLEKSLTLTTLMDGHLVTGHVDSMGKVVEIIPQGDSKVYKISFDEKFGKYMAEKASVTLDGISLTVCDVGDNYFTISLVDYTLQNTTIGKKKIGDPVHLEFDILAKYLEKLNKK